jgi:DNA-binding IclR family transcriptional regulator
MLPAQPNQSLIDGLTVIQALAMRDEPIGCRELARESGLELTKINRLLKTLAHIGLAQQDKSRKYIPGPGIHVLASQALHGSGLLKAAFEPLEKLSQLKVIVALGVLWRDHVSYLYYRRPGFSGAQAIGSLGLYPASRSSIGMIMLANMKKSEVKEIYSGKSIPGYERKKSLFFEELIKVQKQDYVCFDHDRKTEANFAVAVGLPPVGAVAISGSMNRKKKQNNFELLKDVAGEITDNL